jgi:hypothetical protein
VVGGGRYELLEPPGVDVVGIDRQPVAARFGDHYRDRRQTTAQARHLGA